MTRVKIDILKGFRHIYGSKDIQLRAGTPYYLDIENEEEVEELIYMMSGTFPYRFFISVEMTPELMKVISGFKFDVRESPPVNPQIGQVYYNTLTGTAYIYSGSDWLPMTGVGDGSGGGGGSNDIIPALTGDVQSSGFSNEVSITPGVISDAHISPTAGIQLSKLEKNPLDRANHFGSQPSSSISDFIPRVRSVRLNEMASPVGNLNMNDFRIVNLATPLGANDAANKRYVDDTVAALGFVNPLPLNKGGTGVNAQSSIHALNALEGVYSARNLGTNADGGRLFANKTIGQNNDPSYLNFRRLKVRAPLTLVENTDYLEISMGGQGSVDINDGLAGYPLKVEKGGTGSTTPQGARTNLGAIGRGQNMLSDATNVGNIFREVATGTDMMRFRSLVEGNGVDLEQLNDRVTISVDPQGIDINDLNGNIDLEGSKITGVLPITRGGTGSTNAADARDALDVVRTARSLGGNSLLGSPVKDTNQDLNFKGLMAGNNISITSDANTITISAGAGATFNAQNVGQGSGRVYRDFTGSTFNFKTLLGGSGLEVTDNADDISFNVKATSIGSANHILSTPIGTAPGSFLEFKGLLAGDGIGLTEVGGDIIITATEDYVSDVQNIGGAAGEVFSTIDQGVLNLRTIGPNTNVTNPGITVETIGDEVLLNVDYTDFAGENIGTAPGEVFSTIDESTYKFRTIGPDTSLADPGITVTTVGDEILLSATTSNVDADNLGTGEEVLSTPITGGKLEFRTLKGKLGTIAQDGLSVETDGDEIVFQSNLSNIDNVGSGSELVKPFTGPAALVEVRSLLSQNNGLTITEVGDEIHFESLIESVESLSNAEDILDTGFTTPGAALQFRGVKAGSAISLANSDANDVVVDILASEVGNETSLLRDINPIAGQPLTFKTLKADSGVTLDATDPDVLHLKSSLEFANVGTGEFVYKGLVGTERHEFKSLLAGDGLVIDSQANELLITSLVANIDNATTQGETLISSTVPLTAADAGSTVEFKSIESQSSNLTLTSTADLITLDLVDLVNDAANIGTHPGQVFKEVLSDALQLRTIGPAASNIVTVATNGDHIDLDLDLNSIDLNDIGGGPLSIENGGTSSNTAPGARSALDVVYQVLETAANSGVSLLGPEENPAGEGRTVRVKGLLAGDGITITEQANELLVAADPLEGLYGIETLDSTIKVDIENLGADGVNLVANPAGGDNDPVLVRKLKGGDNVTVTQEAGGEVLVDVENMPLTSTNVAVAPVEGPVGTWSYTINHNFELPSPYNQVVYTAINEGTGEIVYLSMMDLPNSTANALVFRATTGGASPGNLRFNLSTVV